MVSVFIQPDDERCDSDTNLLTSLGMSVDQRSDVMEEIFTFRNYVADLILVNHFPEIILSILLGIE